VPLGPPALRARPKDDRDAKGVQVAGGRLGVAWTVAYYVILVGGAVAFYEGFWVLTESKRALAVFGK